MMVGIETVSKTEKEIYELDEAARQGYQAVQLTIKELNEALLLVWPAS